MFDWAKPLLEPYRYKCFWGGRGSGKSHEIAEALLIEGVKRPIRVLCGREFQNSIKESVHFLLRQKISDLGLESHYKVQETEIFGLNGTMFFFKGIRHNIDSIKSLTGITHCWIEEGQTISRVSWEILVPTIRENGSEIWVSFNPMHESDPVWVELVANQPPNSYVVRVNWDMNPLFPATLNDERVRLLAKDPNLYNHIWEGGFLVNTSAQVLGGMYRVQEFVPDSKWSGPYHGGDWGFSSDPTTAVRVWIDRRILYVEYESYAHDLNLDEVGNLWIKDIPGIDRYVVRADNSQPSTIRHVKQGRSRDGVLPIPKLEPVEKWPESIEDGIKYLRSYDEIIIHPRCKHTLEEARLYSYKVDRVSGDILPVIVDANNHCWDAIRYSIAPIIRRLKTNVGDRLKAIT